MNGRGRTINSILGLFLGLLCCACQSAEDRRAKKQYSTLRFHLEVNPDSTGRSGAVPVNRESPIMVNVQHEAFLDEGHIVQTQVVEAPQGFAFRVQFNTHGARVLESVTTRFRGQRVAIHANFDDSRWLAALEIRRTIRDGVLVFRPDADREEADRLALGLNNVAKRLQKSFVF